MNNEKFARENKRIIEGMGIGAFVGPILALVMMYVNCWTNISSCDDVC